MTWSQSYCPAHSVPQLHQVTCSFSSLLFFLVLRSLRLLFKVTPPPNIFLYLASSYSPVRFESRVPLLYGKVSRTCNCRHCSSQVLSTFYAIMLLPLFLRLSLLLLVEVSQIQQLRLFSFQCVKQPRT